MERMFFILTIAFLISTVLAEPWKLKYNEEQSIPKEKSIARNYPSSGQNENDYRWIVMQPQSQASQYQSINDDKGSAQQRHQAVEMKAQSAYSNTAPQVEGAPTRDQSRIFQDAQERMHARPTKYNAVSPNTVEHSNIKPEQMLFNEVNTNEQARNRYEGETANVEVESVVQAENQPSGFVSSATPPREYVLPPLYESSYAYPQPTIIQSQMPAPIVMQHPPPPPQAHYITQYIPQPEISSSNIVPAPISNIPQAQSRPVPTQTVMVESPQQQQQQTHLNDEYSRMDASMSSDLSTTYCRDYNPETKHQVLFKDPESNIHFLTCIGKNQLRRMVCPRYTVFNDFNKQCVERHQENFKCGPCENGGRCIPNPVDNSYRCECPINFRGDRCEIFDDPCKRNPCGNGLCFNISQSPGYLCQCRDYVFNDNCNDDVINNCHKLSSKRFYADKGNLFVHCSDDGLAFVKKCPPGMMFNDIKETCTFPPSYTRSDMVVHPPGSFRSDSKAESQDRHSRPKRSALWAW